MSLSFKKRVQVSSVQVSIDDYEDVSAGPARGHLHSSHNTTGHKSKHAHCKCNYFSLT